MVVGTDGSGHVDRANGAAANLISGSGTNYGPRPIESRRLTAESLQFLSLASASMGKFFQEICTSRDGSVGKIRKHAVHAQAIEL